MRKLTVMFLVVAGMLALLLVFTTRRPVTSPRVRVSLLGYEELSASGAEVQLPPTDQTWGIREMGIRDPDGNVLGFATKPAKPNVT